MGTNLKHHQGIYSQGRLIAQNDPLDELNDFLGKHFILQEQIFALQASQKSPPIFNVRSRDHKF